MKLLRIKASQLEVVDDKVVAVRPIVGPIPGLLAVGFKVILTGPHATVYAHPTLIADPKLPELVYDAGTRGGHIAIVPDEPIAMPLVGSIIDLDLDHQQTLAEEAEHLAKKETALGKLEQLARGGGA